MSLRAFVTGATGFIGSHVARELCRQGWSVSTLARPTSPRSEIEDLDLEIHTGDIVHSDDVLEALPSGADAVFHVAASTNVWSGNNDEQDRINIGGTRNVIEAAVRRNVGRLVYTSSFTTYGFHDTLITEHSPRLPNFDWINYVRTKRIAEELVRDCARSGRLDGVILSPGHVLGPGDRRNWSRMIRMVDRNRLPGVPPGGGSFADVREVARAHVNAYDRAESGETYLLGGVDVTFLEVITEVCDLLGKQPPKRATPAWLLRTAARLKAMSGRFTGREPDITPESAAMIIHDLRCDSSRAKHELDYRITPLRPLLQDTIDWMKKAGLLT